MPYASHARSSDPGARIDSARRQRFARIARRTGPAARQVQQPRGQRGERSKLQGRLCCSTGAEGSGIAAPHELKIPAGDFEARHIAIPAVPEQLLLERH